MARRQTMSMSCAWVGGPINGAKTRLVVAGSSSGETRLGERYEVTETPGYVERTGCFRTFYTRNSGGEWYVASFRQPQLACK